MYPYTAIVTCLAVALYFFFATQVARARIRYGVKLPAISGNADFERIYRIQMNTLEWSVIFLPSLWLFAVYVGDPWAAIVGLLWIVGRIVYFLGYREAVPKRTPGFAIQATASIILWAGALGGAVWRLVH
ncbi:MAPEG family protein [Bradyrhizobium sp. USDA 3364]